MNLARTIGYWTTTALVALAMGASAFGYLSGAMNEAMGDLGYPLHFILLLGTWKALGAIGLLVPALPRVKEWVYAGFFFTFTGAAIAHAAVGDLAGIAPPLIMLGLLATSYVLRPARLWVGRPLIGAGTASDAEAAPSATPAAAK